MNIQNFSKIPAELVLDLRGDDELPGAPDGIESLIIKPEDEGEESILKSVNVDYVEDDHKDTK